MAVLVVPTSPDSPNYVQRTTLDGREYLLRVLHNARENVWYMTILDTEEQVIKAGIKVVTNWPLTRKFKHDVRMPPGEFFAISQTRDRSSPKLGELGADQRVRLFYFEQSELADVGL